MKGKRIITFIFLFTCCIGFSFAQPVSYPDSLRFYEAGIQKKTSNSTEEARLRIKIVEICLHFEKLEVAKKYLNENILLEKKGKVPEATIADMYDLLGELAYLRKDTEEAKSYYFKSLRIREKIYGEKNCWTALSYSHIGKYYSYKIEIDSAFLYTGKAVEILSKYPEAAHFVPSEIIYCNYAYATKMKYKYNPGDYVVGMDTARFFYTKALQIATDKYSHESYQVGYILHQVANTYTDDVHYERLVVGKDCSGSFKLALKYYRESHNIFIKTTEEKSLIVSNSYYARALLYEYAFGSDSLQIIVDFLDKAIEALDVYPDIKSISVVPDEISSVNQYQLLLLLNRKINTIIGFSHGRLGNEEKVELKILSELTVKLWDIIFKEFNSDNVHQILAIYSNLPFQNAISLQCEQEDWGSLRRAFEYADKAKYSTLIKTLLTINPATPVKMPEINITKLQDYLDNQSAFIEYFYGSNQIYAFIITKDTFSLVRLPLPDNLPVLINSMRNGLVANNMSQYSSSSYELFQKIFLPIKGKLSPNITKLKIVPDGILSYIPFDALISEPNLANNKDFRKLNYLLKKYNISYAFSASLLLLENQQLPAELNFIAVTPNYKTKSDLFFSAKLSEKLEDSFQGSFYSGFEATSQLFKRKPLNSTILHLAAHAVYDEKDFSNSGFFFSDYLGEDKLTLNEISKYSVNAQLGVLMGCETGMGTIEHGEGIVGLPRALKMAGVRNIISTLWKIDDKFSSMLLESFYLKLADGVVPEDALHLAKIDFINSASSSDLANPFYWAGIIYTGDSSSVELKRKTSLAYWLLVLPFLFTGLFYLRKKSKLF